MSSRSALRPAGRLDAELLRVLGVEPYQQGASAAKPAQPPGSHGSVPAFAAHRAASRALRATVQYWRQFVPEDGVGLDVLVNRLGGEPER